jgi:hypothetical protein
VDDSGEHAFLARDAYRSVAALALLQLIWGVLDLALVRALPFWPFGAARLVSTTAATVALLYFVRTWERPDARIAVRIFLVAVAMWLVLVAWTGWAFAERGLHLEIFLATGIAMVSMALVAPGSFWLGIVMVLLFQTEVVVLSLLSQRRFGLDASLFPPERSVVFAALGIGLLVVREQRRRRVLRHLRVQAEAKALRELEPLFVSVRTEIDGQLSSLSAALRGLDGEPAPSSPSLTRMSRALARIGELSDRLQRLQREEPATPTPPNGVRPDSAQGELVAEHRLIARDAHGSAILGIALATMMFALYASQARRTGLQHLALVSIAAALASLIAFGYLLLRRRRPSERIALTASLASYVLCLSVVTWGQVQVFSLHNGLRDRPFLPLSPYDVLMVTVSLVVATRFRVAIALVLLTGASATALYFFLDLRVHRDLVPVSEPWSMFGFLLLALGLVMMREQRRIASVQLFRAEWELLALRRQSTLFQAMRDRLGSALQSLVLSAAQLALAQSPESILPIRAGVERLMALSQQLATSERELVRSGTHRATMDADVELQRRA